MMRLMRFSLQKNHSGDSDWMASLEGSNTGLEKNSQKCVTVILVSIDKAVNQDRCIEDREDGVGWGDISEQDSIKFSE